MDALSLVRSIGGADGADIGPSTPPQQAHEAPPQPIARRQSKVAARFGPIHHQMPDPDEDRDLREPDGDRWDDVSGAVSAGSVFVPDAAPVTDDIDSVLAGVGDDALADAITASGGDPSGMTSEQLYEAASAILAGAPEVVSESFRARLGSRGRFS